MGMNARQLSLGLEVPASRRDTARNAYIAKALMEDSSGTARLMESICERENMLRALQRVEANDGAPGVDGMTCRQLRGFVKRTWQASKQALLSETYQPLPVRGKEIPKPDGGGMRKLGIPAVMDRLTQQATVQPLVAIYDHTFSDSSYGYRPERSQAQAVERYRQLIEEGYTYVISLDLSKFFDRVNHERLLSRLGQRIKDRRVLKLIRAFLKSGIVLDDLVEPTEEGTPQGGPLSPLLSNIVLDELDKELERRGHRFVRYADDIVILVRSRLAGERVLASITRYITGKLKLKVNAEKSRVARPWEVKFLGYKVTRIYGATRAVTHPKTVARFQDRVREITCRKRRVRLPVVIADLNQFIRGWLPCYGRGLSQALKRALNRWIIRRLKAWLLKQWRKPKTKVRNLMRLGLDREEAVKLGNTRRGLWRLSGHFQLNFAMPEALFVRRYGLCVLR
jgi:RNA-directed DNA polymerase